MQYRQIIASGIETPNAKLIARGMLDGFASMYLPSWWNSGAQLSRERHSDEFACEKAPCSKSATHSAGQGGNGGGGEGGGGGDGSGGGGRGWGGGYLGCGGGGVRYICLIVLEVRLRRTRLPW